MKRIIIILLLLGAFCVKGQDIHFSQFYMNPVYLNPALTGNFEGDWRFSGNQRSQWRSVSRPFNTIAIAAENREELLINNLFFGGDFFHDAAGDGDFRTVELNLSAAYQLIIDQDSIHSVTPGIQFGLNHRNINPNKLSYDTQFNGFFYDPTLPSAETFQSISRTGFNFSIGAIYTFRKEERQHFTTGIGWFNLPRIKQSFYGDDLIKRDRRLTLHGKGVYELDYQWDLQPGFMFQFQGVYKELVLGSNIRYIYKDKKGEFIAPYAGLWFRNRDAVYITVGAYYNQWIAGISYDVNVSKLVPASNIRGGLEFSVQYILHLFKPLEIKHRICPDYL